MKHLYMNAIYIILFILLIITIIHINNNIELFSVSSQSSIECIDQCYENQCANVSPFIDQEECLECLDSCDNQMESQLSLPSLPSLPSQPTQPSQPTTTEVETSESDNQCFDFINKVLYNGYCEIEENDNIDKLFISKQLCNQSGGRWMVRNGECNLKNQDNISQEGLYQINNNLKTFQECIRDGGAITHGPLENELQELNNIYSPSCVSYTDDLESNTICNNINNSNDCDNNSSCVYIERTGYTEWTPSNNSLECVNNPLTDNEYTLCNEICSQMDSNIIFEFKTLSNEPNDLRINNVIKHNINENNRVVKDHNNENFNLSINHYQAWTKVRETNYEYKCSNYSNSNQETCESTPDQRCNSVTNRLLINGQVNPLWSDNINHRRYACHSIGTIGTCKYNEGSPDTCIPSNIQTDNNVENIISTECKYTAAEPSCNEKIILKGILGIYNSLDDSSPVKQGLILREQLANMQKKYIDLITNNNVQDSSIADNWFKENIIKMDSYIPIEHTIDNVSYTVNHQKGNFYSKVYKLKDFEDNINTLFDSNNPDPINLTDNYVSDVVFNYPNMILRDIDGSTSYFELKNEAEFLLEQDPYLNEYGINRKDLYNIIPDIPVDYIKNGSDTIEKFKWGYIKSWEHLFVRNIIPTGQLHTDVKIREFNRIRDLKRMQRGGNYSNDGAPFTREGYDNESTGINNARYAGIRYHSPPIWPRDVQQNDNGLHANMATIYYEENDENIDSIYPRPVSSIEVSITDNSIIEEIIYKQTPVPNIRAIIKRFSREALYNYNIAKRNYEDIELLEKYSELFQIGYLNNEEESQQERVDLRENLLQIGNMPLWDLTDTFKNHLFENNDNNKYKGYNASEIQELKTYAYDELLNTYNTYRYIQTIIHLSVQEHSRILMNLYTMGSLLTNTIKFSYFEYKRAVKDFLKADRELDHASQATKNEKAQKRRKARNKMINKYKKWIDSSLYKTLYKTNSLFDPNDKDKLVNNILRRSSRYKFNLRLKNLINGDSILSGFYNYGLKRINNVKDFFISIKELSNTILTLKKSNSAQSIETLNKLQSSTPVYKYKMARVCSKISSGTKQFVELFPVKMFRFLFRTLLSWQFSVITSGILIFDCIVGELTPWQAYLNGAKNVTDFDLRWIQINMDFNGGGGDGTTPTDSNGNIIEKPYFKTLNQLQRHMLFDSTLSLKINFFIPGIEDLTYLEKLRILLIKAQINAGYRLATKRNFIRNGSDTIEIMSGTCLTKKGNKVNLPIQIQNKIFQNTEEGCLEFGNIISYNSNLDREWVSTEASCDPINPSLPNTCNQHSTSDSESCVTDNNCSFSLSKITPIDGNIVYRNEERIDPVTGYACKPYDTFSSDNIIEQLNCPLGAFGIDLTTDCKGTTKWVSSENNFGHGLWEGVSNFIRENDIVPQSAIDLQLNNIRGTFNTEDTIWSGYKEDSIHLNYLANICPDMKLLNKYDRNNNKISNSGNNYETGHRYTFKNDLELFKDEIPLNASTTILCDSDLKSKYMCPPGSDENTPDCCYSYGRQHMINSDFERDEQNMDNIDNNECNICTKDDESMDPNASVALKNRFQLIRKSNIKNYYLINIDGREVVWNKDEHGDFNIQNILKEKKYVESTNIPIDRIQGDCDEVPIVNSNAINSDNFENPVIVCIPKRPGNGSLLKIIDDNEGQTIFNIEDPSDEFYINNASYIYKEDNETNELGMIGTIIDEHGIFNWSKDIDYKNFLNKECRNRNTSLCNKNQACMNAYNTLNMCPIGCKKEKINQDCEHSRMIVTGTGECDGGISYAAAIADGRSPPEKLDQIEQISNLGYYSCKDLRYNKDNVLMDNDVINTGNFDWKSLCYGGQCISPDRYGQCHVDNIPSGNCFIDPIRGWYVNPQDHLSLEMYFTERNREYNENDCGLIDTCSLTNKKADYCKKRHSLKRN